VGLNWERLGKPGCGDGWFSTTIDQKLNCGAIALNFQAVHALHRMSDTITHG
jgi:hypothetical protein